MKSHLSGWRNPYFRGMFVAAILTLAAGWILTGYLGRVAEKEFRVGVEKEANLIASYLRNDLDDVENAAKAITQADQVIAVLARRAPAEMERANRLLDRVNKNLEMSVCYLLDETGLTIASSNRNGKSGFVGKSFAFRPYFKGAMAGRLTPYYALGSTSGERGYYAASPVIGTGGAVLGVIVVKRDIAPIGEIFRKYTRAFLVSPEGIIFMSSRSDLLYRAFWPVEEKMRTGLRASHQFGNIKFEPLLEAEPKKGMYARFEDIDLYVQRLPIGHEGWTLLTMDPPDVVSNYRLFGILLTLVFGLLLQFLVFALWQKDKSVATARELLEAEDDLKEYTQRLELVLEGSNDATWEHDVVADQAVLNDRYYEMLEYTPGEANLTLDFFRTTIHPDDLSEVEKRLTDHLEGRTSMYRAHYRMVSKSGKVRYVLGRGKVVRHDEDGRPMVMAGVITDVTEMKKLGEEVNRIHNLESIGLLAGGLAHDFNNMMNIIYGNITFAKMIAVGNPAIAESLTDAEEACEHAKALGVRLQAFSLGTSPAKEPVVLAEIIEDAAGTLFHGANISLTVSAADGVHPVEADSRQIRQMIDNLLTNAKEAMPGGGTVKVEIENYICDGMSGIPMASGNYLSIAIQDNGKGIPAEDLSKVFDLYFSTKDTFSQRGLGLGLPICHSITKRHQGFIGIESEVGVGTKVTVFLPASERDIVVSCAERP